MKKTLLTLAAVLVAALVLTACTNQTEKALDAVETTAAVLQEAKARASAATRTRAKILLVIFIKRSSLYN